MPENKVIALEGIDGSGKTTAGKLIAEAMGGRYFYCMENHPLAPHRKRFDTAPLPARFLYYLAVPLINYSRLEEMRTVSDVFIDRSVASTIAYHKAFGLANPWFKLIPPHLMNQIDLMLYFTADEEERKRRVYGRAVDDNTMTASDIKSFEFGRQIDAAYRQVFTDRTLVVDTNGKNATQTAAETVARLRAI